MSSAQRVWKVFCRAGWGRADYAGAAYAGGFVAVGGERTGPIRDYTTKEEFLAAWARHYPAKPPKPQRFDRAHHLWHLEHDVACGDWICMPSASRVTFLGLVEDDRTYWLEHGDPECPFGHRRHVRWLYEVGTEDLEGLLRIDVVGRQTLNHLNVAPADLVRATHALAGSAMAAQRRRYWAMGANPARYRIEAAVREREHDLWATSDRPIARGDRLVVWKFDGGTGHRGLVALAEVIDTPRPRRDAGNGYWVEPEDGDRDAMRALVRYVLPPRAPLWLGSPEAEPLARLSISRARGGAVFNVSLEEWAAVLGAVGGWPEERPEVHAAEDAIDAAAGRASGRGQGWGLTAEERRAVERRAMDVAAASFRDRGYTVLDCSATESYDLVCTRGAERVHVEVKGTTGTGWTFVITRNEHRRATALHPATALAFVRGVRIGRRGDGSVVADLGDLHLVEPWRPDACSPDPIAYECQVPRPQSES